jgi:hypothetical protein
MMAIGSVAILSAFLVKDPLADRDATVADVDPRAGDQLADFGMTLSAERAHRQIGGSGHVFGG